MSRSERLAIRVSVLVGGAILMSLEVAGFRIIGRTFGSALRETTTVIAVFLTAMSLGYWAGGRAGDRWPRTSTLGLALMLASMSLLAVPWLDRAIADRVAQSSAALATHAFIVATALFAVPTFLLTSISPIAVRLFATTTGHSGSVAGSISALSTIGSVLTAFFLIDWLASINRIVVTLSVTALVLAALLGATALPRLALPRLRLAAVTAAIAVAVLTLAFVRMGSVEALPSMTAGTKVIFERDTQYHRIVVVDRPGRIRDLLFDRTIQSRYYMGDPDERGLEYAEFEHIATLMQPIRRVLLIGITFLKTRSDRYDLSSIDANTRTRYGSTIPPHLATREFFVEVAAHLNDGGVVHYHLFQARAARFSRAMYKTMTSVFPAVRIFGQTELIARKAPIDWNAEELIGRAGPLRRHNPRVDAHIGTLGTDLPRMDDVPLMTDDYAPVDTLLRGREPAP